MANNGNEHKNIVIKYGPDEYRVSLPQQASGEPHLVNDLAQLCAKVCCVPVDNQRLIFKGKSLVDQEATLASYGITNNSKVMLIMGNKPSKSPAETTALETLRSVEVKSESLALALDEIQQKISHVQKGLSSENPEAIRRLILGNADSYMRLLETMDALDLVNLTEPKSKRKELVKKIQAHLDRNDQIKESFDNFLILNQKQQY